MESVTYLAEKLEIINASTQCNYVPVKLARIYFYLLRSAAVLVVYLKQFRTVAPTPHATNVTTTDEQKDTAAQVGITGFAALPLRPPKQLREVAPLRITFTPPRVDDLPTPRTWRADALDLSRPHPTTEPAAQDSLERHRHCAPDLVTMLM